MLSAVAVACKAPTDTQRPGRDSEPESAQPGEAGGRVTRSGTVLALLGRRTAGHRLASSAHCIGPPGGDATRRGKQVRRVGATNLKVAAHALIILHVH